MTDDFHLFPDRSDVSAADADIALITAYLAAELSPVQIAAVEDRLATDTDFRDATRPLIDAWTVPGSIENRGTMQVRAAAANPVLSRAEIDAGWQRYRGERHQRSAPARRQFPVAEVELPRRRKTSLARIAAILALTLAPLFAFAQMVRYIASHADAPGHAFVRRLVPAPWLAPREPSGITTFEGDGALSWSLDSPVQQTLPLARQQVPQPVRVLDLPAALARATPTLGAILGLKQMSDGRVLVNDPIHRQMLLFERDLTTFTIVLDSVPGTSTSYSPGPGDPDLITSALERGQLRSSSVKYLVPHRGDSAVFGEFAGSVIVDVSMIRTFLVLDGRGNVVRAMPVERILAPMGIGTPWLDSQGRYVYAGPIATRSRTPQDAQLGMARWFRVTRPNGRVMIMWRSDSIPILRITDPVRGTVDTLGYINLPVHNPPQKAGAPSPQNVGNGGGKLVPVAGADGVVCWMTPAGSRGAWIERPGCVNTAKQVVNPLYHVDDWALLSDGTIAFVRGHDYHIDWIHPDGSRSSSAKLPYDWIRLSDDDKKRLVDSTRASIDSLDALAVEIDKRLQPWKDSVTAAARAAGARRVTSELAHEGPPVRVWPYEIVPLSQIADYYPPIRTAASKPDADGNLWILPRTTRLSRQGELVYDVVNPTRGLAQRVRLPLGRSIAGFGKGGVVYLQHGDLKSGFVLERSILANPIPK